MSSFRPLAVAVRGAAVAAVLFGAAACASNPNAATHDRTAQRGDRYVITAAELETAGSNNLYEAIQKLRPDYFRVRGASISAEPVTQSSRGSGPPAAASSNTGTALYNPPSPIKVYVNDQLMTGVDDLRQTPVTHVLEVRFVPGPQAAVRYGTNHSSGAILVKVRQ